MKKKFFRIRIIEDGKDVSRFEESDEILQEHAELITMDVPLELAREQKLHVFSRDNISQLGKALYVQPGFDHEELKKPFEETIRKAGFKGEIIPHGALCDGGHFIVGEKFVFFSQAYKDYIASFASPLHHILGLAIRFESGKKAYVIDTMKYMGRGHSNGHIDTAVNFIDEAKIIYGSGAQLEKIAKKTGYELREDGFLPSEEDMEEMDILEMMCWAMNGPNFLSLDGKLITGFVRESEKEYLASRGIEVITCKYNKEGSSAGSGVRCRYGEFYV